MKRDYPQRDKFRPILNNAEEEREEAVAKATLRTREDVRRGEDKRVEHALRVRDMTYFLDH